MRDCLYLCRPSQFEIRSGVMATEAIDIFRRFYERGNPSAPDAKRARTLQPAAAVAAAAAAAAAAGAQTAAPTID